MSSPAPSIDCILPNELYIGNLDTALSPSFRRQHGITHVISAVLCSIVDLSPLIEEYGKTFQSSMHMVINIEDSEYEDILIHLPKTCKFIQDALRMDGGRVLVHCVMGISRSATIIAAYLMQRFQISAVDAVKRIRESRSIVHPNYGFFTQLDVFEQCGYTPSAKHPLYMDWRRQRKNDITQFLSKFCDITTVLDDKGETLYLSSDFPLKPKQVEAFVLDLEITHLVHITPCKIGPSAVDLLHGNLFLELNLQDPEKACGQLQDATAFVEAAYQSNIGKEPKVLIHCDVEAKACAVAGAYLMMTRRLGVSKVTDMLCSVLGPLFEPTRNLKNQLEAWQIMMKCDEVRSKQCIEQNSDHARCGPVVSRRNSHIIASSIQDILKNTRLEGEMNAFSAALKGLTTKQ